MTIRPRVALVGAALLLALPKAMPAIERAAPETTVALGRAEQFVTAGQWVDAASAYTEIIAGDAGNWRALVGRANAYNHLQVPGLAEADEDTAVKVAPSTFEPLMARGLDLYLKKRYADAIRDLDGAIRLKPGKLELYHWRGCAYAQNNQPAPALEDFSKVIERDPDGLKGMEFFNRALAEHAMGKLEDALADYERAEKGGQHAANGRAECLLDLKRWKDAEEVFNDVLQHTDEEGEENQKTRFDALRNRSVALTGQKLYDRAEADLAEAMALQPDNTYVLGTASWTRIFAGKLGDARNAALKALAADPTQIWIHLNLAHTYLLEGHFEWAQAIYIEEKDKRGSWGRTGAQIALQDLADLREAGIDHRDMKRAEELLRTFVKGGATVAPFPSTTPVPSPTPAQTP